MSWRVKIRRQELVLERLQHLFAVGAECIEGRFEHRSESSSCEQLLEDVGDEHEQEVRFGGSGVAAVHVFQSEATVLEHVETFVFAAPTQP